MGCANRIKRSCHRWRSDDLLGDDRLMDQRAALASRMWAKANSRCEGQAEGMATFTRRRLIRTSSLRKNSPNRRRQ
jgi:hypothetical protein